MATSNGFLLFRFKTEEELQTVIGQGPWMFGGKNIVLQQWHPHFCFDKNKISSLPVWIRLRGLPFPLWTKQGLSQVASMVGKPLSCDEHTHECTRLDFARVCVEVDAALPFVHHFEIVCALSDNPIRIEVEYEWKPRRCDKCKVFGHSCPKPQSEQIDTQNPIHGMNKEDAMLGHTPTPPITILKPPPTAQTTPHILTKPASLHYQPTKQPLPTENPSRELIHGETSTKQLTTDTPQTPPTTQTPQTPKTTTVQPTTKSNSPQKEKSTDNPPHKEVHGQGEAPVCLENKMASIQSESKGNNCSVEIISPEQDSDTGSNNPRDKGPVKEAMGKDTSPALSWSTVKKRKGGRKKREV
ncbi:proline-rich receptor protein [Salix suchowensis]|nr:proline-rich receptor protein [Salix suchowensis]